jgi:hypothetical protein
MSQLEDQIYYDSENDAVVLIHRQFGGLKVLKGEGKKTDCALCGGRGRIGDDIPCWKCTSDESPVIHGCETGRYVNPKSNIEEVDKTSDDQ